MPPACARIPSSPWLAILAAALAALAAFRPNPVAEQANADSLTIGGLLREMNEPARIRGDHAWYVRALRCGAGHSHLLRQCVLDMPGWRLVEPNAYLPGGAGAGADRR